MVSKEYIEKIRNTPAQFPDGMDFDLQLFSSVVQPTAPATAPVEKRFYNVPNSPASDLMLEVISSGADIGSLPARKKKINNNTNIEVLQSGSKRAIRLKTNKAEVTIELADIEKFVGNNKPAKKLLLLTLIKAGEQAIHNGELTRSGVTFPLQELIDNGMYDTPQSARRGFKAGGDILTSIKIKGKIKKSKTDKNPVSIDALEVPFTGYQIKNGQCTIYLNERISWSFIAQYFTILPKYYFKLPNRASDLLFYVFYLARQNTASIKEKGYFTISFRAIQSRLQLPSETATKNPLRDIREPIEEAVEKIEEEHRSYFGNCDFQFELIYNEDGSIADFLNGYLKIFLKGEFAETFVKICEETEKQIAEADKRRKKRLDNAISQNIANSLKEKDHKTKE